MMMGGSKEERKLPHADRSFKKRTTSGSDFGHVMHSHSKLSKSTNKIKFVENFHQLHEEPFTAKTGKGVCISGVCVHKQEGYTGVGAVWAAV
jgi:hypothetical protein